MSPLAMLVDVLIEGKRLSMEVDTGTAMSVFSRDTLLTLLSQVILSKTRLRLWTFTGEKIPLAGMVQVNVSYKKQTKLLILYVTNNPCSSLLGKASLN